jgi:hypothetical protein
MNSAAVKKTRKEMKKLGKYLIRSLGDGKKRERRTFLMLKAFSEIC